MNLRFTRLSMLLLLATSFSVTAHARKVCQEYNPEGQEECFKERSLVDAKLLQLAGRFTFAEEIRDQSGKVKLMTQEEAKNQCSRKNSHLPTVRELAVEATKFGAEILETRHVLDPNKIPEGFVRINAINPDGTKDSFYYSADHFVRRRRGIPNDTYGFVEDIKNGRLLFSDEMLSSSSSVRGHVYVIDVSDGSLSEDRNEAMTVGAVRCFQIQSDI